MSHDLDLGTLCSIKAYRNLHCLRLAASERAAEREPFLGDLIHPGLVGDALELVCTEGSSGPLGGPGQSGGGTKTRSFGPKLRLPRVYWGVGGGVNPRGGAAGLASACRLSPFCPGLRSGVNSTGSLLNRTLEDAF